MTRMEQVQRYVNKGWEVYGLNIKNNSLQFSLISPEGAYYSPADLQRLCTQTTTFARKLKTKFDGFTKEQVQACKLRGLVTEVYGHMNKIPSTNTDSPDNYFCKWVIPCGYVLQHQNPPRISPGFTKCLEEKVIAGAEIDRNLLEKLFKIPIYHIKRTSGKKNPWDYHAIKDFFRLYHNALVDKSETKNKELCKVRKGLVTVILKQDKAMVFANHRNIQVSTVFTPEIKVGDWVAVHHLYAIEQTNILPRFNSD